MVLDQPEEAAQVEPGHGDDRGSRAEAQTERDLLGEDVVQEDVVQREPRDHDVAGADPVYGRGLAQARDGLPSSFHRSVACMMPWYQHRFSTGPVDGQDARWRLTSVALGATL